MKRLHFTHHKHGGKRTAVANTNNRHASRPSDDGLALAAEPSYQRGYDDLLTLEEAVRV